MSMRRANVSRIAVGQRARRRLVGRSLAADHVGRNRPRRPAKTDQRRLPRQVLAQPRNGLVDAGEFFAGRCRIEPRQLGRRRDRIEARALAFDEAHALAQRVGNDEDVGKQDRRVKAVAADRLQRHLGGECRRVAQLEEAADRGAHLAVLRQVAAGLAHQPHRRRRQRRALQHADQPLAGAGRWERLCRRTHVLLNQVKNLNSYCSYYYPWGF